MAHLPDAGPAIAPGHDLRRQAQPGCNAPQVKARYYDIFPAPAAVAASGAGKTELRLPLQKRHGLGAGKIHLPAQVDVVVTHG